jgi:exopolysaccharide biosynthesis WecB/TagA/CpsF family protein
MSNLIIWAAQEGNALIIDHMPVHGLIMASKDPSFRAKMNAFDIVAPDGHPVRWALSLLHDIKLPDRVYGPQMMLRLCRRAAEIGVGVYLYGGSQQVVEKLSSRLVEKFPALKVMGAESPPFRALTREENETAIERVNSSGAGIVFLGLGCPKQEVFAYECRHSVKVVQICVGAAFDFIAGNKKMAPEWMQRNGLEWFYRLTQEPRRLWRRYLWTNSVFLFLLARSLLSRNP